MTPNRRLDAWMNQRYLVCRMRTSVSLDAHLFFRQRRKTRAKTPQIADKVSHVIDLS